MHESLMRKNAKLQMQKISTMLDQGQQVVQLKSTVYVDDQDNLHSELTIDVMNSALDNADVSDLFKQNQEQLERDPHFDINKDIANAEHVNGPDPDSRLSKHGPLGELYTARFRDELGNLIDRSIIATSQEKAFSQAKAYFKDRREADHLSKILSVKLQEND